MKIIKAFSLSVLVALVLSACGGSSSSSSSTEYTLTLRGSGTSAAAQTLAAVTKTTSASSAKIKVYAMAVSTDPFCTNPVTVFEVESPEYVDFLTDPVINSGLIAEGTYPCVIMEISDAIMFTPQANDGTLCVAGTEYTDDVCSTEFGEQFQLIDGTTGTCSDGEQRVASYWSSASACANTGPDCPTNPFLPPTTNNDGERGLMISDLIITADTTKTFVFDTTNQVNGVDFLRCVLEAPSMSFE